MLTYKTTTTWKSGHLGELQGGNGIHIEFSAPADLYGHPNVLTPEDAFVGALNMCFQLMFLWSCEKLKIKLLSYTCDCIGIVVEHLDRTSTFQQMTLRPRIQVQGCSKNEVSRAISLAKKYSLIAKSITADIHIEPQTHIVS
jgi:organic hydroperoxide reductase OsmC/OhrA